MKAIGNALSHAIEQGSPYNAVGVTPCHRSAWHRAIWSVGAARQVGDGSPPRSPKSTGSVEAGFEDHGVPTSTHMVGVSRICVRYCGLEQGPHSRTDSATDT